MRATTFGLLAASLTFLTPDCASAGLSRHAGGIDVFSFGQHDRGGRHRHFAPGPAFAPPAAVSPAPPADADAADVQVIYAPIYVPAAPAKIHLSSGPRIIVIGAHPSKSLPVVIYGVTPLDMSN